MLALAPYFHSIQLKASRFTVWSLILLVSLIGIHPAHAFDADEFWREPTTAEVPLDVAVLQRGVERGVTWQAMVYTSEIYRNEPMRIFAYYAHPRGGAKAPAVVYIHGGGGNADLNRAIAYARQGYACLAFDWNTYNTPRLNWNPGDPLPTRNYSVFGNLRYDDWQKVGRQWQQEEWGHQFFLPHPDWQGIVLYRGVMATRRALTWLSEQPDVNADQLVVEGQSWGGFMAQLVAGIDPRIKATVSSAAAGAWASRYRARIAMHLQLLSPSDMQEWTQRYDPAAYARRIKSPLLVFLGASDFFGSIDTLAEYWPLITAPKSLHLIAGANHLFGSDITRRIAWFNHWLHNGPAFPATPHVTLASGANNTWTVRLEPGDTAILDAASFAWTTSPRAYDSRFWAQQPLRRDGGAWTATFTPTLAGGPLRIFASVRDVNGFVASALPLVQALPPATAVSPTAITAATVPIQHTTLSPIQHPEAWAQARPVGPIAGGPEVIGQQSATLSALWDSKALYLNIKADDPTPWLPLPTGPPFWNGDSVQLRICSNAETAPATAPPAHPTIGEQAADGSAGAQPPAARTTPTTTEQAANDIANPQLATPPENQAPTLAGAEPDTAQTAAPVTPTITDDEVLNINWYPDPDTAALRIFVVRGLDVASVVNDVASITAKVTIQKGAGYSLIARIPWSYIDPAFKPAAGRSIRLAMLVNQGDLLTSEWIGGPVFNGGQNVYNPETWGLAILQ